MARLHRLIRLASLRRIAGFAILVAWAPLARTDSPPADAGPASEATTLRHSREAVRYNVAVAGAARPAGGAMVAVDAPLATIRQIVGDFARYQDFMPGFQKSRILAKGPAGTDVYLQAPILHGAATLWAVVRFSPLVRDASGERIEGRRTGAANVDDLRATWRFYSIDPRHTVLKLELLVVPSLPLPVSMVTPQLEESAEDAVRACRDRAEALAKAPEARADAH